VLGLVLRVAGLLLVAGVLVAERPGLAPTLTLAVAALVAAVLVARRPAVCRHAGTAAGVLRRWAYPALLLRQRDPDAAGSIRPRAPTAA
jgi:Family of unknown function (DUF6412)